MIRFWIKVNKDGPVQSHVPNLGKCWVWTSAIMHMGYGCFWLNKKTVRAHRLSWELAFGKIPGKKDVLHKCDNRACVNPAHLFLGDVLINAADREAKGRGRIYRGIQAYNHKLTEQDVLEIRANAGKYSKRSLAALYRVSEAAIYMVLTRRNWAHLPASPQCLHFPSLKRRMERQPQ